MSLTAAELRVNIVADTSDAEEGVSSFNDTLKKTARGTAAIGGTLTAAITAPLVGIATAALSSAAAFEQNMNVLQQVLGASTSDMAAMQAEALHLGAVTSFSAGEAAEAMLELGKAGMDTNEIIASVGGVLDLAAAGGISMASAANITANALNAFHLEATQADRIANIFAATANASSADITDLAAGMQAAGFAFANANQPVENLAASLAILTNVGLTGSDAGTALKNAMMRMMNPTQEALAVMKQLNISFYDAQGNMKQLPVIIDMLNASMAGLTAEQRDAALSTIFMSDGMKAMLPLMDQGSTGFNKMVGAVTRTGAATEVAGARMQGLTGGIEYLKGSIDSFLIGAALPFTEQIGAMARRAGDMVSAFGSLSPRVVNTALAIGAAAAAAGPLMLAFSGLLRVLAMINPTVAIVVTAVAALGAAWASNLGGIQEITAQAVSSVQGQFNTLKTAAKNFGTSVKAAFEKTNFPTLDELWNDFKAGDFQTLATTIRSTAFDLMVNLDAELNITAKATVLRDQLVGAVDDMMGAITKLDFGGAQVQANGLRDSLLHTLTQAINGVNWGQGGATFAGLIDSLSSSIAKLDFSGINWADVFKRVFLGPAATALAGLQWVIGSGEFDGLKTAVSGAIGTIPWGDLGTAFAGLGSAILGQLGQIAGDIVGDLSGEFGGLSGLKLPEFKLPKIDVDWGQLTINTVGLLNSVTQSINNIDWLGVGASVGSAILGAVKTGITAIGASIVALNWANDAIASLKLQVAAWALNVGFEIGSALSTIDWIGALVGVDTAIKSAINSVLAGAMSQVGKELNLTFKLPTIDWSTMFGKFAWTDYITSMDWATYVGSLAWGDYVALLDWVTYVTSLSWTSFITNLSWSSFISDVSWSDWIPSFSWGDWIPSLDWSRFIPWLGALGGGAATANATGTPYWQGGLSWVGERGPELVNLPRGSRVYNNGDSMAMAGSGITVNVNVASLSSDMDTETMALRVAKIIQRKMR